jgi:hypothetical protein
LIIGNRVFVCCAAGDKARVEEICKRLERSGLNIEIAGLSDGHERGLEDVIESARLVLVFFPIGRPLSVKHLTGIWKLPSGRPREYQKTGSSSFLLGWKSATFQNVWTTFNSSTTLKHKVSIRS